MKYILTFLILLLPSICYGVDYSQDANCQGYWPMEQAGGSNETAVTGTDIAETGGTIDRTTDKAFGTYSRTIDEDDTEYFKHGDGNETDFSGADQEISLVVSIKSTDTSEGFQKLIDKTKYYFGTFNDAGYFALTVTGTQACVAVSDVVDQTLHNLAAVYNDTDMRIYVDGSVDTNGASNPKTYSSGFANDNNDFAVGSDEAPSTYYDGLIDEVAIFDRELDSTEISDINTNGIGGGAAPSSAIKTINGLAKASVKEVDGLAIGSVKSWDGLE